jgi:hypothetical protein
MAFKLIESAQRRWRMVNAPHLVALVRAGATFVNGKLVERPEDQATETAQPEAALPASACDRKRSIRVFCGHDHLVWGWLSLLPVPGSCRVPASGRAGQGARSARVRRRRRP